MRSHISYCARGVCAAARRSVARFGSVAGIKRLPTRTPACIVAASELNERTFALVSRNLNIALADAPAPQAEEPSHSFRPAATRKSADAKLEFAAAATLLGTQRGKVNKNK
jgi:hypothetical protein